MTLKKGDFVELDYVGRIKETEEVFDTTRADVPHDHHHGHEHAPVTICIGEGHILPGIDVFLEGKALGKHVVNLAPEAAFGKRRGDLIQLIQTQKFLKQQIRPVPGGRVNIDGMPGTIRSVSGGRTIVDFNHPLAGKDVSYELDVKSVVDDKKKQIEALLKVLLHLTDAEVAIGAGSATITFPQELPEEVTKRFIEIAKNLTGLAVGFEVKKQEAKKSPGN